MLNHAEIWSQHRDEVLVSSTILGGQQLILHPRLTGTPPGVVELTGTSVELDTMPPLAPGPMVAGPSATLFLLPWRVASTVLTAMTAARRRMRATQRRTRHILFRLLSRGRGAGVACTSTSSVQSTPGAPLTSFWLSTAACAGDEGGIISYRSAQHATSRCKRMCDYQSISRMVCIGPHGPLTQSTDPTPTDHDPRYQLLPRFRKTCPSIPPAQSARER